MFAAKFVFTALLLSVNYFFPAEAVEYLTIYENTLTEAQKTHTVAVTLLAIEKSTDRTTIANTISTNLTTSYGGNWNVLVTGAGQSGSALKLQNNRLIRFAFETFEFIVFQLNSTTTTTPTETDISVITAARNSSIVVQYESSSLTTANKTAINSIITNAIGNYSTFHNIEDYVRSSLNRQIGGNWLVIVTESGPSFDSNWSGSCIHLFRELYIGRLRIFMYQFTT